MGEAIFAGRRFRIDPSSIRWDYDAKVKSMNSVGGKVVQVYGTTVGNMTLEGAFGTGGWEQQLAFLQQMRNIGVEQASDNLSKHNKPPLRFTYPPKNWDFQVHLKDFSSPDGQGAANLSIDNFNPKWTLTLFIAQDNADLEQVATNAYIARLAKGIGWNQSEFNAPLSDATMAPVPFDDGGSGNSPNVGGFPQAVARWAPLVARYFPSAQFRHEALQIIQCESEGNPNAYNKTPVPPFGNASGLFQHLDGLWASRSQQAGVGGADIFDPEANTAVAYWLFAQTNTWQHWACKRVINR